MLETIQQNPYIWAIFTIAFFWALSYIVTIAIGLVGKVASKTESDIDDKIIDAIKLPIRYLAILMGIFYAGKKFDWSVTIKEQSYGLQDAMFVLIALLIGFTASRILKVLFVWYGERDDKGKMNQTMFIFVRKMISVFVYAIALVIILGQLGIQIGPLLAGLGVAGLAIALGLQSTLENLFSALFLVMDKSINIGDWIQLDDGTKAYIEDISWRSVRIRTITGNTVIVPNSSFVSQNISSYDYPVQSFYTSIEVGVSYDTDLEKAEYVAMQAAEKVIKDAGIKEAENNPTIRYKAFGDSSINFIVIVKVDAVTDEGKVQHMLIKEIKKQFDEQGIEIPFPQRVIHKVA